MQIAKRVWFQNAEDLCFFETKITSLKQKGVLIKSSGVNLKEYSPEAFDEAALFQIKKEIDWKPVNKYIIMVTRPLWNKGVREFIKASELIGREYPSAKFILVGGLEKNNILSVPEEFLRKSESNNFKWLGFHDEIREIQLISDISVLPSYYPEGVPRNLLEAMAMSRPIITTNTAGCRDTVEDGKNGYLIPTRDTKALASAIKILLDDSQKRVAFGKYSRLKVEREFDVEVVTDRIIKELYA